MHMSVWVYPWSMLLGCWEGSRSLLWAQSKREEPAMSQRQP